MKKLAYILVLSLPFFGFGCQQNTNGDQGAGAGAHNPQYSEDSQSGMGQVDENGMGSGVSNNGGTVNNSITRDSMHNVNAVGETEAARATEKTQTGAGNSHTRGEENHSKSRTTKNRTIKE